MSSKTSRQTLKINGEIDVSEAAIIMDVLVAHYDLLDSFNLDMSDVKSCDDAGIQLLTALQTNFNKSGKPLVFSSASRAVRNALCRNGVNPEEVVGKTWVL